MRFSRRKLLQHGLIGAGASVLPIAAQGESSFQLNRRKAPSILQGATDESRTQFSVVHGREESYRFNAISGDGQVVSPDNSVTHTLGGQPTAVSRVFFSGLNLDSTYMLRLEDSATGDLIEEREFRTLNTATAKPRFAICSCMDDSRHSPGIWRDLIANRPDFILFVGDSVYCDFGGGSDRGEARLWRRFSEARATLEIYFSKRLIPVLAVWDDHDFGENDAGRDFPYVKESQVNFMRFFAMDSSHCRVLERGPGVSSCLMIGGQQFLLMDDRSWRIAGKSRDRYAHWGREQEEWMLDRVGAHAGMNWIVNGSQIFPQLFFKQSASGEHPVQFAQVCQRLQAMTGRVAFISGDVHYSEISEIEREKLGYGSFELTSSSIHSFKIPGLPTLAPNSRRIASTGEHNYLLVESEAAGAGCQFRVESRSEGGQVNFTLSLMV